MSSPMRSAFCLQMLGGGPFFSLKTKELNEYCCCEHERISERALNWESKLMYCKKRRALRILL
jgi:hypothetical protein